MSFGAEPEAQRGRAMGCALAVIYCCWAAHVARPFLARLLLLGDTGVRHSLVAVATDTDVGLLAVAGESFQGTQA